MYRSGEDDVARQIGDRKVGIARNDAAAVRAGVFRGDIACDTGDHGDKFRTGQLFIRCERGRGVALDDAARDESRRRLTLVIGHGAGIGENAQLVCARLRAVIDEGARDVHERLGTGSGIAEIAAVVRVDEVEMDGLAELSGIPLVLLRSGERGRAVLLGRAERTVEDGQRLRAAHRVVRQHFAVRTLEQAKLDALAERRLRPVTLHVRKFGVGRSGRGLGAAVTGVAGVVRVAVAVKRRVAGRRSARNGERDRKCARVQQERVVFRDLFGEIVLDIDAAAVDFARNSRRGDGLSVHFDVQLFVAVAVRDRGGRLLEALAAPSRQRQHDAAGAVLAALGARDLLDILIRQPYLAVRVGCGKGRRLHEILCEMGDLRGGRELDGDGRAVIRHGQRVILAAERVQAAPEDLLDRIAVRAGERLVGGEHELDAPRLGSRRDGGIRRTVRCAAFRRISRRKQHYSG